MLFFICAAVLPSTGHNCNELTLPTKSQRGLSRAPVKNSSQTNPESYKTLEERTGKNEARKRIGWDKDSSTVKPNLHMQTKQNSPLPISILHTQRFPPGLHTSRQRLGHHSKCSPPTLVPPSFSPRFICCDIIQSGMSLQSLGVSCPVSPPNCVHPQASYPFPTLCAAPAYTQVGWGEKPERLWLCSSTSHSTVTKPPLLPAPFLAQIQNMLKYILWQTLTQRRLQS